MKLVGFMTDDNDLQRSISFEKIQAIEEQFSERIEQPISDIDTVTFNSFVICEYLTTYLILLTLLIACS